MSFLSSRHQDPDYEFKSSKVRLTGNAKLGGDAINGSKTYMTNHIINHIYTNAPQTLEMYDHSQGINPKVLIPNLLKPLTKKRKIITQEAILTMTNSNSHPYDEYKPVQIGAYAKLIGLTKNGAFLKGEI